MDELVDRSAYVVGVLVEMVDKKEKEEPGKVEVKPWGSEAGK